MECREAVLTPNLLHEMAILQDSGDEPEGMPARLPLPADVPQ
jgi:hypothetical protein